MNPRYLKGSSDTDEVFKADLRINVTEFFGSSAVVREESRTPAGACHCERVWLQRERDPNGPPRHHYRAELAMHFLVKQRVALTMARKCEHAVSDDYYSHHKTKQLSTQHSTRH